MMTEWTIALPWPPTVNHLWKRGPSRTYLSAKGRQFRDEALASITRQLLANERIEERVAVTIRLFPPTRAKMDIDNRIKAVLDALMYAQVLVDDEQVDDLQVVRKGVVKGGHCAVTIRILEKP